MENITVFAKASPEQATAKLVIQDFVEVMKTSKPGKGYTSDTFTVGDTPMAIKVYPNGFGEENLYDQMMDPNFSLVFQGVKVPCHKHVLAATSPVFEAMVVNQHLEAIESTANIELSEEVGRAFAKYMYIGELEEDLLKEHAVAFLELGNKYIVQELKDLAEGEMLKQLNKKNMVRFLSIGDLFNANKIFEAALKMTKANMNWLRSQVSVMNCKLPENSILNPI